MIIAAIFCAFVIHELGHYVAAFCFGHRIKFRFAWGWLWGKVPIPRYLWYMPDIKPWKQKVIAVSGFGAEIVAALLFWAVSGVVSASFWEYYAAVALLHFVLYPYYAGEESDFKWIGN